MKNFPPDATPLKSGLLQRIWEGESYGLVLALLIISYVLLDAGPTTTFTNLVTNMLLGVMLVVALRAARVRVQVLLAAMLCLRLRWSSLWL